MDRLGRRQFIIAATAAASGLKLAGCIEEARQTQWSKFRATGDNQASTREHPGRDLELGWEINIAEQFNVEASDVVVASPIGDSETMYITSRVDLEEAEGAIGTGVLAIDVETGSTEWSRLYEQTDPLTTEYAYPPVLWEDLLLVIHGHSGTVFNREDGSIAFEFDLPWVPETVPGGDRALVALGGDLVAMVDMDEDQDVRWTLEDPEYSITPVNPLTVLDDRVYVPVENRLITLRRGDGERIRDEELVPGAQSVRTSPPIVDGFYMHLRLRDENGEEELRALNRSNRSVLWQESLGGVDDETVANLQAYRGGRLYVTHNDELQAYHVGNGERDFTVSVDVTAPFPTVGGDDVYLQSEDELVIVDRHTGELHQRIDLPGSSVDLPKEAVPRSGALVVTRGDRVLGYQSP